MAYRSVFARYENKYLLSRDQYERLTAAMTPYMAPDDYGLTTIRNVYYDTPTYRLIRRSLEKPVYKEKLRLRSYRRAEADSDVFVEIKKKYKGVVYKRRVAMPESQAMAWLAGGAPPGEKSQIAREIETFRRYYGEVCPTVFLSYDRQAWYCRGGSDFRVTFDTDIRARCTELSLERPAGGALILPPELVLMELKCGGGIPLWMVALLTEEKLYKTSFSKYGTAYQQLIFPKQKEAITHE
ncbi:MAG: polyphosphate polymerase domain-containing protein [Oscillospiraceae bacterium]|nr:polyphosphate polymerase domain-containing protein [Oscillospiraceae bacterium]